MFQDACPEAETCYCPILDKCSHFNYSIELNHLIEDGTADGNHNREYHFWVEVINAADLAIVEEVTILVDDSPPETGVVINGPAGSPERDFQSDDLLQWHWRSFVDHESGISKYHWAVGHECFTMEDLQFLDQLDNDSRIIDFDETVDTHAEYLSDYPDYYHISVIAFNNAMDPSKAVCSRAVLIDKTPPVIKHLHLATARTQPSIACSINDSIWWITHKLEARPLLYVDECGRHCDSHTDLSLIHPDVRLNNNGSIIYPPVEDSQRLCSYLPTYHPSQDIFVPTDNMELSWEAEEPESQIHDFFLGVSSTRENTVQPDIIDFKSTHNKTHHKCVHCGLGEGER